MTERDRHNPPLVSGARRPWKGPGIKARAILSLVFAVALGLAAAVFTYGTIHAGRAPHQESDSDPGLIP
jgi:hypothetical protein